MSSPGQGNIRVLYIASGTGMAGGATKSLLAMLREAGKAGIEYEVICPDEAGLTRYLRECGVKVKVIPYRHACLPQHKGIKNMIKWLPRLIHNSWINFSARSKVAKAAARFAPDIIHENSSAIDVGYHAAKRLGIPDVIHIREYGDLDFKLHLPGRDKRLADANTYTISITKDIARHKDQDKNPRGIQIYNGIVKEEQIRYTPEKKPYFLYAGRIEEAKGVDSLIKAYARYAKETERPLKLLIVGGSNYPDFLALMKFQTDTLGISDLVEWPGQRDDIADLMYEATATIIPSRFEALGRVMPEAMANGSLCVGRNTGGTKEQMDNARAFIGKEVAFSYDTTDQLTEILTSIGEKAKSKAVFDIGGEFYEMIMDSQKAVLEFFSETGFGKKLLGFYNNILSDRIGK